MITILMILTWVCYCILEGLNNGFSFNKAYLANDFNNKWKGIDIHFWFTLQRLMTFTAVVISCYFDAGMEGAIFVFIGNMLVFPFIHNGTMYQSRKKNYPLGFFHDPTINDTSTAKINISTPTRILWFALGIGLYLAIIINY